MVFPAESGERGEREAIFCGFLAWNNWVDKQPQKRKVN